MKTPSFHKVPTRFLYFTGKGAVGKTTIAAGIAVGLIKRSQSVHFTTTDLAAHVALVVDSTLPGLTVDRIDPAAETAGHVERIMSTGGRDLDASGQALLREDLASPCTEEVAVFHAVSRTVAKARSAATEPWAWVVIRTVAWTGTTDHLLRQRIAGEVRQFHRLHNGLAQRLYLVPFCPELPVGVPRLSSLSRGPCR